MFSKYLYAARMHFMHHTNISSFHVPHQYQFHNAMPILVHRTKSCEIDIGVAHEMRETFTQCMNIGNYTSQQKKPIFDFRGIYLNIGISHHQLIGIELCSDQL